MTISNEDIIKTLCSFLASTYEAIQRESITKTPSSAAGSEERIESEVERNIRVNQQLNRRLSGYSFEIFDVNIESSTVDSLHFSCLEKYELSYEVTGDKGVRETYDTRGIDPHSVRMTRSNEGKWQVLEDYREEFSSLPTPTPTSIEESRLEQPRKKKPESDRIILPDETMAWTWNGKAAADYSDTYWETPNSEYRVYDNDCTNFASQCLKAGGKVYRDGDRKDNHYWFYGFLAATTSYTWAGAHNLAVHLKDYTNSTSVSSFASQALGDLIFADWEATAAPQYEHTMIVAVKQASDVLVNYHTANTHHRSFKEIMAKNPGAKFLYLKVGTEYK